MKKIIQIILVVVAFAAAYTASDIKACQLRFHSNDFERKPIYNVRIDSSIGYQGYYKLATPTDTSKVWKNFYQTYANNQLTQIKFVLYEGSDTNTNVKFDFDYSIPNSIRIYSFDIGDQTPIDTVLVRSFEDESTRIDSTFTKWYVETKRFFDNKIQIIKKSIEYNTFDTSLIQIDQDSIIEFSKWDTTRCYYDDTICRCLSSSDIAPDSLKRISDHYAVSHSLFVYYQDIENSVVARKYYTNGAPVPNRTKLPSVNGLMAVLPSGVHFAFKSRLEYEAWKAKSKVMHIVD